MVMALKSVVHPGSPPQLTLRRPECYRLRSTSWECPPILRTFEGVEIARAERYPSNLTRIVPA